MTMQISEHRNYGFFTNDDFSARQSYNDPFIYNDFQIMNIILKEKDTGDRIWIQISSRKLVVGRKKFVRVKYFMAE